MRIKFKTFGKSVLYDAMCARTRINNPYHMRELLDAMTLDAFDFEDMKAIETFADGLAAEEYGEPNPQYKPYVGDDADADNELPLLQPLRFDHRITDNKVYRKPRLQIRLDHTLLDLLEGSARYFEQHCYTITQAQPGKAVKVKFKLGDWCVVAYPHSEVICRDKNDEHGILWGGRVMVTNLLSQAKAINLVRKLVDQKVKITDRQKIKKLEYTAHYGNR